jgi:hypothetical protein
MEQNAIAKIVSDTMRLQILDIIQAGKLGYVKTKVAESTCAETHAARSKVRVKLVKVPAIREKLPCFAIFRQRQSFSKDDLRPSSRKISPRTIAEKEHAVCKYKATKAEAVSKCQQNLCFTRATSPADNSSAAPNDDRCRRFRPDRRQRSCSCE